VIVFVKLISHANDHENMVFAKIEHKNTGLLIFAKKSFKPIIMIKGVVFYTNNDLLIEYSFIVY
jgi:hypothetical protein